MSGIAGVYNVDGRPVDLKLLKDMTQALAHRGPDRDGYWMQCSIGLGHRLSWTTPESLQEQQPLQNEDGSLCLTADARVDNRESLIAELAANGAKLRTKTDGELILQAYSVWGEGCANKILGDFAFAIWDSPRQCLFCARDALGIKPFYYTFNGSTFHWASEPSAILVDKTIPRAPNLRLICFYLLYLLDEMHPREETLYQDIYRLPPGHSLVVKDGQLLKSQYWDIEPRLQIRYRTNAEYGEHFRHLFQESVRARLRSAGPIGALLSGGLDSSSVVCSAQRLYQERGTANGIETFSIIFDEFPCDERPYIDDVIRASGARANYLRYEQHLGWLDPEQMHQYPDVLPTANFFMFAPTFEAASQKGIRSMLDGLGGDELFFISPDYLTDLLHERRIDKLVSHLQFESIRSSRSYGSLLLNYCIKPMISTRAKRILRPILQCLRADTIPQWINPACLKKTGLDERPLIAARMPTAVHQRIYQLLFHGFNSGVSLDMIERFAQRFGIESRHPFLDRHLIEFMLAVPIEQRCLDGWPKATLRDAMEGILPDSVRKRHGKAVFSSIVDHNLKHRQAEQIKNLMRSSMLADIGVIRVEPFLKLLDSYLRGDVPLKTRWTLATVMWLEIWCRSLYSEKRAIV